MSNFAFGFLVYKDDQKWSDLDRRLVRELSMIALNSGISATFENAARFEDFRDMGNDAGLVYEDTRCFFITDNPLDNVSDFAFESKDGRFTFYPKDSLVDGILRFIEHIKERTIIIDHVVLFLSENVCIPSDFVNLTYDLQALRSNIRRILINFISVEESQVYKINIEL